MVDQNEKSTDSDVSTRDPSSRGSPWNSIGILLSTFSILVLLFAFYFAYCRLGSLMSYLAERMTNIEHANADFIQKSTSEIQQTLQQLRNELNVQEQAIAELRRTQVGKKDDWFIAEARYLVKLADNNLQMGSDVGLVIKLLQAADQDLSGLSDPKLILVRQALAKDIAAMQAVPRVDYNGLYLRLSALKEQVNQLPLPARRPVNEPAQSNAIENNKSASWWQRGIEQTGQALRQIVVVRNYSSSAMPFVPPGQQDFLYENLYSMLEQASWAVLNRQPDIFRASLQQASKWVKQYFSQDSSVTQAVLVNLNQLLQVDIRPKLPSITNSLQAFQDYK